MSTFKDRLSKAKTTFKLSVGAIRASFHKDKGGVVKEEPLCQPEPHFATLPALKDIPKGRRGFCKKVCCSSMLPRYIFSWIFLWIPVFPLLVAAPVLTHVLALLKLSFTLHKLPGAVAKLLALHLVQGPMSAIDVFEIAVEQDYFLLTWFFIAVPWRYKEQKVTALARYRYLGALSFMIGLPNEEDPVDKISKRMLTSVYYARSDSAALHTIKKFQKKGADLDFKYENGTSILIRAVKNGHLETIQYLLSQDVDTSTQEHYSQKNVIHYAIQRWNSTSGETLAKILELLCFHNKTDFTHVNNKGQTPYMYFVEQKKPTANKVVWEVLRPSPSFEEIEKVLDADKFTINERCEGLYRLIGNGTKKTKVKLLHHLRFIDMLFCKQEGDKIELHRRRKVVFKTFLKPLLLKSVGETKLSKKNAALLEFIYYQSAGPEGTPLHVSRASYVDEFEKTMTKVQSKLEKLYGKAYRETRGMIEANGLYAIPKIQNYIPSEALAHYTFMEVPHFVESFSLPEAARELKELGVVETASDFSDIVQGKHRLFGKEVPPFTANAVVDCGLWQTFVLFWQIHVQEKIELEFVQAMKGLAADMQVEFSAAPGVKKYDRSFEKTKEYALEKGLAKTGLAWYFENDRISLGLETRTAEVLAPMHVIDGLRCSFIVDSVEANLKVGREIEKRFGVARSKNMHQPGKMSYADRKYNLVFEVERVEGVRGPARVICEVQILMRKYIETKAIGHSLYEFQRKPTVEKKIDHRESRRKAAFYSTILVAALGVSFMIVLTVIITDSRGATVIIDLGVKLVWVLAVYLLLFYLLGKAALSQDKRAQLVKSLRESFVQEKD
ncbi:MAG: hypothetical protein SGBAC_008250 [Bacillariaceae sp.]